MRKVCFTGVKVDQIGDLDEGEEEVIAHRRLQGDEVQGVSAFRVSYVGFEELKV